MSTTTSSPHTPTAAWWAVPLAVLGGIFGAIQSRINSQLAADIHDGFSAAFISFGTGLLLIAVIFAFRPGLRARLAQFWRDLRSGSFPWSMALGGLGGAIFVLGQGLTIAYVGVALFIVCVVAGQTVTGLVVDRVGLGPGGPRHLTPTRLIGAFLMVAAVALAMSGGVNSSAPWYLLALPIVSGVAMGMQQAMNGRVSAHTGHFMVATASNFVVGTSALLVAALVHALAVGHGPADLPANPLLYVGGAIGVAFIAMAAHLAHPLGILTLAMTTIAGQIVGSVALDVILPTTGHHPGMFTFVGAGLTLVAALVTAGVFGRRSTRSPSASPTRDSTDAPSVR